MFLCYSLYAIEYLNFFNGKTRFQEKFCHVLILFVGFLITPFNGQRGCEIGYVTHTNPRGKIPTWLTNKVTSYVAPKMLHKLHKACLIYPQWKIHHRPTLKYWLNPEQLTTPRINIDQVQNFDHMVQIASILWIQSTT